MNIGILFSLLGIGALAMLYSRESEANSYPSSPYVGPYPPDIQPETAIDVSFPLLESSATATETIEQPETEPTETTDESAETPYELTVDDMVQNVHAFLALIRATEAGTEGYNAIAGGGRFEDFSEHPFILNPNRPKPLGTTASGAYQMVVGTWKIARDALGLPDFSPASQDAAAIWILEFKGNNALPAIMAGDVFTAMKLKRFEWEAFDKILKGTYYASDADAARIFMENGGMVA